MTETSCLQRSDEQVHGRQVLVELSEDAVRALVAAGDRPHHAACNCADYLFSERPCRFCAGMPVGADIFVQIRDSLRQALEAVPSLRATRLYTDELDALRARVAELEVACQCASRALCLYNESSPTASELEAAAAGRPSAYGAGARGLPAAWAALTDEQRLVAPEGALQGCPIHQGVIHGGEAERLRSGVEAIIESGDASMTDLQKLLDHVEAGDSLGHLERIDLATGIATLLADENLSSAALRGKLQSMLDGISLM